MNTFHPNGAKVKFTGGKPIIINYPFRSSKTHSCCSSSR